jgi:hypothetical protein
LEKAEDPVPYFSLVLSVTLTLKLKVVAKYKAPTTQNFETIINRKNKDEQHSKCKREKQVNNGGEE